MRKSKEHVTICNTCNGTGWVAGTLLQTRHKHKVDSRIKRKQCPACGGRGKFKS